MANAFADQAGSLSLEGDQRPLAVSMGEPAGIGTEVLLKAYAHLRAHPNWRRPFFVIDDPARVALLSRQMGPELRCVSIGTPAEAASVFAEALPVLPIPSIDLAPLLSVTPGKPSEETASHVIGAIDEAVRLCLNGEAAGLVTLPIQKSVLLASGFPFPGHTEYLGRLTDDVPMPANNQRGPVMMLAAGNFRAVPATIHVPLAEVPSLLKTDDLVHVGQVIADALRTDFAIASPRLAVTGLNPHAGENGLIGREEIDVIMPAIKALQAAGVDAAGPFPGDTLFHQEARSQYDAALAMYHDQALIPIKTAAFHEAVNVTIGLPIVRTSPDHGTGLALAGKGVARADSTMAALAMADRMATARASYDT
ncbi:MAG: 4-hydroxythreonine-4-phosphate dehydrogenase PdxA [Pseudomonadota bacterium]